MRLRMRSSIAIGFHKGDELEVDEKTAARLTACGIAEEVKPKRGRPPKERAVGARYETRRAP
jgi:hypothetical protein